MSLFGDVETRVSYDEELELDLKAFEAQQGCDIWLSKDSGETWILIGKTFGKEDQFVYQARQAGLHVFHVHARKGEDDAYRPSVSAEIHAAVELRKMERENPDILYSNRRALRISYEVRDVTLSLPGSQFESWLYYTTTSGLDWRLYGPDEDQQSPVPFVAEADGLYGFKVISADIAGQKEAAPDAGTMPDILVRIDTQAPKISLLSPQPYDLWETGTLRTLRWDSRDEAMERLQSVALYYSIGSDQQWQLLAEGLPSSGTFEWKIPQSDNGKIFIQARAKDRSGNMGKTEAAPPFLTRNILEEMLAPDVREKADGYYATATICRKNRDHRKAVKYYRLSLQLNPYHVRAFNDAGISLLQLGLWEEAFASFESGLKYAPSNEKLMSNLARLYMDHGQSDDAERILMRLVGLYPRDPNGLWLLSKVRFEQGKVEGARDIWERLQHLEFLEDSRGPRYRQLAQQRLGDTLIKPKAKTAGLWFFR
jgi:tetratricopeptide (TPR) repeat protein